MHDQSAKITITVDSTGSTFKATVAGSTHSIIQTIDTYITLWLKSVNDCRKPELSDAAVAQHLLDTVADSIIAAYGDSVLLPALFDIARRHHTNRGETS